MSKRVALLPKTVPSGEANVVQLLIHTLHPELDSFVSAKHAAAVDELNGYVIQLPYKDLFGVDTESRIPQNFGAKFDLSTWAKPIASQLVERARGADNPAHHTAPFPRHRDHVRGGAQIRWCGPELAKDEVCYIVLGITELKNAAFEREMPQGMGLWGLGYLGRALLGRWRWQAGLSCSEI
ncbi:uncharacterized protein BDZ99DRAFT_531107 [Mytilinidion resinicola]|uniref:Uncharacterized protein n=1 Tax=Mytilinidion resinicola TaxID=574789 RepID=A0A6A6Z9Z2_9PEZI|nr:uncharacterized protein BDZ99DRAFT_531107 [Mytilinidion resinicola]KAF2817850.1 hypothetical protein BDZ99DRAFT_531107 [Mytilinidion resinicola]